MNDDDSGLPSEATNGSSGTPSAMIDMAALKALRPSTHRQENSWEDVLSDEERDGEREEGEMHADGWEDESSEEEAPAEGDEATSSAGMTYRQSKQALLNSQSNNMERYHWLMNGRSGEGLQRTDTAERLKAVEPFSAGQGTDSFDAADPIGRAHEVRLESDEDEENRTPTKRDRPSSFSSHPRGDRRSSRATPLDAQLSPTRVKGDSRRDDLREEQARQVRLPEEAGLREDHSEEKRSREGRPKEIYASEPASPVNEEEDWAEALAESATAAAAASPMLTTTTTTTKENPAAPLEQLADAASPFSLWDYLKEEVMATDFDSTQELKWERVTNFIAIPFWMEKIMVFGFAVCLDSFLYTFTILPLRSLVALVMWLRNTVVWLVGGQKRYLHSSHKCDMLKALLIILSCYILSRISDASKMYHSVRGQDVVKLYVIFNVLEIADRLCCSFGQDLLDSLFSRLTLARRKDGGQPYLRPAGFFLLSLAYVLAHTLVLFYQLVTLNVAINSYDNALLTLLLSNQFVEIKGSVFKKFEKENLFQLTCADIVERFQLTLMLSAIGLRNLIEVAGASSGPPAVASSLGNSTRNAASRGLSSLSALGPLPTSFTVFPSFSLLETTFTPVCIVLASECLVDWLKHAFITKFNHIRPSVYGRFMDVLCRDLTIAGRASTGRRRHTFVDQSPVVSRRLGFAAIPLACLLVRMTSQIMGMLRDDSHFDECAMPADMQPGQASGAAPSAVWMLVRSSAAFLLGPLVSNAGDKVDLALKYAISAAAWILTIFIAWIFLVAVKLLLGTNLVSYASHRYSTMDERESEEEINARGRQPIGIDKEEKEYEAKVSQLIDKRDDDASRIGLNGQPMPVTPYRKKERPGQTSSLMDVDRYSMIRSRIW